MIAVIDNYDSFTYNVVQNVARLTSEEIKVFRSRETALQEIIDLNPSRLIVSPGPGRPENAGISVEAIRYFAGKVPILGVCLGHQAIAYAFGAEIVSAKHIRHGIVDDITTDGKGVFRILGKSGKFTRYHSLVVKEDTLPPEFEVTARSSDGDVMGIRHKTYPIEGVQFHPESAASGGGDAIFQAFLNYRLEGINCKEALTRLLTGADHKRHTAELFKEDLAEGMMDERQMAGVLTAIAMKGPSAGEMAGCASVLVRKKTPLPCRRDNKVLDIVGTGGDGKGSFNISSLAGLVIAAAGCPVAKHGNKAISSKSGAADFYSALGINVTASPEKSAAMLDELGFCFLFAPVYHKAMRFAGPVRTALGIKTVMNLIGPLSNPADAAYQMLGCYSRDLIRPMAEASKMLGSERVMLVNSEDGFDEISPYCLTHVCEIDEDNIVREYDIDPSEFGITGCEESQLAGGTAKENAELAMQVLEGRLPANRKGIYEAVAMNAGAALYISGNTKTIKEGYEKAKETIDSGAALAFLEKVKAF